MTTAARGTLEEMLARIQAGAQKEVAVLIKADIGLEAAQVDVEFDMTRHGQPRRDGPGRVHLTRMALALVAMATVVVAVVIGAFAAKLLGATTPGWVTIVTGFALSLFLQTGLFTMITLIVSSLGRG